MYRIALAALLLSGCCLCPVVERPPAAAQVVDAQTQAPVAGARVHVETWQVERDTARPMALTLDETVTADAQGFFHVPLVSSSVWFTCFPLPVPHYRTRYSFAADGYRTLVLSPWVVGAEDSGEIVLPARVLLERDQVAGLLLGRLISARGDPRPR